MFRACNMVLWLMEGDIGTVPRRWTQTYGQCRHHHQAREGQPALKHWFLYPIRNKFPGLVIKTDQLIPAVNIILDDKRWKQSIYHLPNTTNNNRSKPSQNCGQKHQRKMTVLWQSDQHSRTGTLTHTLCQLHLSIYNIHIQENELKNKMNIAHCSTVCSTDDWIISSNYKMIFAGLHCTGRLCLYNIQGWRLTIFRKFGCRFLVVLIGIQIPPVEC